MRIYRNLKLIVLLLSLFSLQLYSYAEAQYLKGRVSEEGRMQQGSPGLTRKDVGVIDPFSGESAQPAQEVLDVPPEAFKVQPPPAKPKQPFNLQAMQQGFMGQPMRGMPANNAMPFDGLNDNLPVQPQAKPAFNPQDPDSSPDMQLAWDMWHKRVAAAIFERFNFFARAAFRHSPPLLSHVSYVVTRDGHIQNLQMGQKSNNVLFNVLVFQTVKSLDGDMNLLQFPQGSRRQVVQKYGTFTQNYGDEGFRYTVGDRETVGRN
jgi:hypothetical protein